MTEEEKPKFKFKCPICNYQQYCPCEACTNRIPEGFKPFILDGNLHICANCKNEATHDWWLDIMTDQLNEWKKENESTF